MTRIVNVEDMKTLIQGAGRYMDHKHQVYGIGRRYTHPYAEIVDNEERYSPVGVALLWLGIDPFEIEKMSRDHALDCPDEDYEPDCQICAEGGDTSIYNDWVTAYIEAQGASLTDDARDLLWEAESSGLPLWEWLGQNPHHPALEPPEFALGATLTFDEYQERSEKTAIYDPDRALEYLIPGLAAEAGEVADKYAKWVRDGGNLDEIGLLKEVGDVLWFVAQLASALDEPLGRLAEQNLEKLEDRRQRGVLGGSGDNR